MDAFSISLSVYTLSGAALAVIGVQALRTAGREKYYAQLKRGLGQLRLSRMLAYLGADVDAYVQTVPVDDLNLEMQQCARCKAVMTCDACLRDGKHIADMNFCPVYRSVIRHSRLLADRR